MKKDKINTKSILNSIIRTSIKLIIGILLFTASFCAFFWYNNTLFLLEARWLWPQETFVESKFKNGTTLDRAKMSVDLIHSKKLIGAESDKIQLLLGPENGDYYYNDSNSTYRLTERKQADWVLTFVSGDDGKIRHIFIRKSCCSVSRMILNYAIDVTNPAVRWLLK